MVGFIIVIVVALPGAIISALQVYEWIEQRHRKVK